MNLFESGLANNSLIKRKGKGYESGKKTADTRTDAEKDRRRKGIEAVSVLWKPCNYYDESWNVSG